MSSISRYKAGVVQQISVKTNDTYPLEVSDLVYLAANTALPASALADAGSAAQNRAAFAAAFLGVNLHKVGLQTSEHTFLLPATYNKGQTLVATTGDFEFDCAATAWQMGDLVGVYASADGCSDQVVAKVTELGEAIGIAVPQVDALGVSRTKVVVRIRPKAVYEQVGSGL